MISSIFINVHVPFMTRFRQMIDLRLSTEEILDGKSELILRSHKHN
jgi:hypothetical protein